MLISDTKEFGRTVRERRKNLGYTQAFLSDFSGFSTSFISELENGKETIEIGKAMKLAQILGMDICLSVREERQ